MKTLSSFREDIAVAVEKAYNRGAAVNDWDDLEDAPEVIEVMEEYMNADEFDTDIDTMEIIMQEEIENLKQSKS
jgi:hypothetical protein